MKLSTILRAVALIFAAGSFGFVSSAKADDAKDAIVGIIGEAIAGAAEAEGADEGDDPRCAAWESRCEAGDEGACALADSTCGGDEEGGDD
jgi:hypothetical protein